ncbi:MAG: hypothetical protein K6G45_02270 [Lachnospiraceae bacterium]|nr:hypothetical protein [Lachnospiraceae bacterium]
MAKRPVFVAKDSYPFYEIKEIDFTFHSGFAVSQKQRSISELHDSYNKLFSEKVLEISSKSPDELGVALSAFNLMMNVDGEERPVESIFQGSKCFEAGGPYVDLYNVSPWEAKKDERIRNSGELTGFELLDEHFGNEPKDYFYNWIYIKAVYQHGDYLEELRSYGAFTDIEFNPKKSINCQAKAIAIAVGLDKAGLLDDCMNDKNMFLEIVYKQKKTCTYEQMSLFD